MVTAKETVLSLLGVAKDRLEDSDEGLFDLVLNIVIEINRKVIFQHVYGILRPLKLLRTSGSFNHDIRNSVSHRRC